LRGKRKFARPSMVAFAVVWSLPGLYSNHNAFADWRSGPSSTTERVQEAAPIRVDYTTGQGTHHDYDCHLAFADGTQRQVHRYSVGYVSYTNDPNLIDAGDPCNGIHAGEVLQSSRLPKLDELVSIAP